MTTTLAAYNLISSHLTTALARTAKSPQVANETNRYLARIEKITSIDEFLKDDRTFRYAMKAFGLSDMSYAKAFMRKVLTEGVDSSSAFANKLSDTRYRDFAATFNFQRYGTTTTIFDRTRQGTVDRYVQQSLEENAGTDNDNVRLALYFARTAPTVTSAYEILADKALTQVVYTALGLPALTSAMDIDAQARLINARIDLTDFQTPAKLARFVTRFAAMSDVGSSNTAASGIAPLTSLSSTAAGLSADVLLALQSVKLG